MSRAKKDIDDKKVADLALDGASNRDIAAIVGCDDKTVANRFSALLHKKRAERRMKIRRAQMQSVESGNATMQIWLGKQELDQVDKQAVEVKAADAEALREFLGLGPGLPGKAQEGG